MLLAEMLIESALTSVADKGLASFSMRVVAAAIGRSTTAIVQQFGNRDGLLAAMVETAFKRDERFHAAFRESVSGLSLGASSLTEIVAHYIESRVACHDAAVRVWPELMFNGGQSSTLAQVLTRHRQMREDFWRTLVPRDSVAALAPLLADYTVMEGVYAIILHGPLGHRLLLRETVAHLLDSEFSTTFPTPTNKVQTWLEDMAPLALPRSFDRAGASRTHLLDIAAEEILTHGTASLNHRRLTAKAGVSPAMIVYHFGSMEQFTVEAVWHALLAGLPAYLDDSVTALAARQTADEWPAILAQTLALRGDANTSGFYIGYSRIVG
ncbi:MAG: TetR/AcrR family transcriptional regulator, partial [Sphingobium sp.]